MRRAMRGVRVVVFMVGLLLVLTGCGGHGDDRVFEGWGYPKGEIVTFAGGLEDALDAGNYGAVARQVRYPMPVRVGGEHAGVIENEEEFVEAGPGLMDAGVVKAVRDAANGKRLLVNAEGVMFGAGAVWVTRGEDGKLVIVAIHVSGKGSEGGGEGVEMNEAVGEEGD